MYMLLLTLKYLHALLLPKAAHMMKGPSPIMTKRRVSIVNVLITIFILDLCAYIYGA